MVDSPLGDIKGAPSHFAPSAQPPILTGEPLPELSDALMSPCSTDQLVDFAQEIIASMVVVKPEQGLAVTQRNNLLNQVFRLIEVKKNT